MSDQLLASPLLPSSPRPTQAISSIIHYPHSLCSGPDAEETEGENKQTWRKAMVRMVTCGLYKSLRGWQGPATLCLLPLKDHLEGTSHSPPWASPLVLPTSAPTSCRSMDILSLLWWPSYPWQLGICSDGYGCDRSTSLQAATPWIWALTWLQPQK